MPSRKLFSEAEQKRAQEQKEKDAIKYEHGPFWTWGQEDPYPHDRHVCDYSEVEVVPNWLRECWNSKYCHMVCSKCGVHRRVKPPFYENQVLPPGSLPVCADIPGIDRQLGLIHCVYTPWHRDTNKANPKRSQEDKRKYEERRARNAWKPGREATVNEMPLGRYDADQRWEQNAERGWNPNTGGRGAANLYGDPYGSRSPAPYRSRSPAPPVDRRRDFQYPSKREFERKPGAAKRAQPDPVLASQTAHFRMTITNEEHFSSTWEVPGEKKDDWELVDIQCYRCGETGHISDRCPARRAAPERRIDRLGRKPSREAPRRSPRRSLRLEKPTREAPRRSRPLVDGSEVREPSRESPREQEVPALPLPVASKRQLPKLAGPSSKRKKKRESESVWPRDRLSYLRGNFYRVTDKAPDAALYPDQHWNWVQGRPHDAPLREDPVLEEQSGSDKQSDSDASQWPLTEEQLAEMREKYEQAGDEKYSDSELESLFREEKQLLAQSREKRRLQDIKRSEEREENARRHVEENPSYPSRWPPNRYLPKPRARNRAVSETSGLKDVERGSRDRSPEPPTKKRASSPSTPDFGDPWASDGEDFVPWPGDPHGPKRKVKVMRPRPRRHSAVARPVARREPSTPPAIQPAWPDAQPEPKAAPLLPWAHGHPHVRARGRSPAPQTWDKWLPSPAAVREAQRAAAKAQPAVPKRSESIAVADSGDWFAEHRASRRRELEERWNEEEPITMGSIMRQANWPQEAQRIKRFWQDNRLYQRPWFDQNPQGERGPEWSDIQQASIMGMTFESHVFGSGRRIDTLQTYVQTHRGDPPSSTGRDRLDRNPGFRVLMGNDADAFMYAREICSDRLQDATSYDAPQFSNGSADERAWAVRVIDLYTKLNQDVDVRVVAYPSWTVHTDDTEDAYVVSFRDREVQLKDKLFLHAASYVKSASIWSVLDKGALGGGMTGCWPPPDSIKKAWHAILGMWTVYEKCGWIKGSCISARQLGVENKLQFSKMSQATADGKAVGVLLKHAADPVVTTRESLAKGYIKVWRMFGQQEGFGVDPINFCIHGHWGGEKQMYLSVERTSVSAVLIPKRLAAEFERGLQFAYDELCDRAVIPATVTARWRTRNGTWSYEEYWQDLYARGVVQPVERQEPLSW